MNGRLWKLKLILYAPVVVAVVRILMTLVVLIVNPWAMSFRFIQVIPLGILVVYTFLYLKLYSDADPVVTLLLPSILHFFLIFVFKEQLQLSAFAPLLLVDCLYLFIKGVKGGAFPFVVEGEEDSSEELLNELVEEK